MIMELTGHKGKVVCGSSKPDGQPIRMLDVNGEEKEFEFKAKILFGEGLK